MNVDTGSDAVVTARMRGGWMEFRECGAILCGGKLSLKMNGSVYRSCVTPSMMYGSESRIQNEDIEKN